MGSFGGVSRYLHRCQFFYSQSVCQKLYSCNKILGELKNGEIGIIFVFLEQIWAVLGVFRGTCIVANFFIVSLRARNCIPAIKLLAISKTAKLELFRIFAANKGSFGVVAPCFEGSQFFRSQSACQKWYSGNKIIGKL